MLLHAYLHLYLEDIVLKVTFLLGAIGEDHFAITMLNASDPFTLVTATIGPVHFAIAVPLVLLVLALIYVSARPLEHPIAVLLVIQVVTLIAVALRSSCAAPLALTFFHACFEVTHVTCAVTPGILTFAIGLPIYVFARVGISIDKYVCSRSVLKAHVPFPLIPIAILPRVHPIAMCFALVPLTYVTVIEKSAPNAVPVLQSCRPLAVINLSVDPSINALSIGFSHLEISIVAVAVWVALKAFAMSQIFLPLPLILASIGVLHDSTPVTLTICHYA